jgi:Universal stress protein family
VRLSANADLLVVGTREPIHRRPYLAGSISHYCISNAACPVVTVPEPLPYTLGDPSSDRTRFDETAVPINATCTTTGPIGPTGKNDASAIAVRGPSDRTAHVAPVGSGARIPPASPL